MKTLYLIWSLILVYQGECSVEISIPPGFDDHFDSIIPPTRPPWPYIKYHFPYEVQSPTDIQTRKAELIELPPLVIHFFYTAPNEPVTIENTGYYLEVLLPKGAKHKPYITGGPLIEGKYVFEQLHFHWGECDACGSEHHLDGKCLSTEVHVVFFREVYGNFKEAMNHPDGIAVLAYFGQISPTDNPDLKALIHEFGHIIEPETSTKGTFEKEFEFLNIMFKQTTYYAFPGSLTTPSYSECVTWIICPTPFAVSSAQLQAFRELKSLNGTMLTHNDRELQDFGNRPIVAPIHKHAFQFAQEILITL